MNGNTGIITADLTNFYSCLHVAAQTENSDIFINNKMYGKDKWQGMVAPGKYVVETRKRGFMTQAKTIDISESDSVVVCFDKMKLNTGSLRVNYKPDGSEVIVDGKSSGVTPLLISEIPIGEHRVSIIHESYEAKLIFIKVEDGQDLTVEGTLHIDYPEEFKKSLLGK